MITEFLAPFKKISKILFLFTIQSIFFLSLALAQTNVSPDQNLQIDKPVGGEIAVAAIGDRLTAIANKYGIASETLKDRLLSDPTLQVTKTGDLVYDETPPQQSIGSVGNSGEASSFCPGHSLADVFTLHSKAGSSKTIYLDFNGHVVSGTQWNDTYNLGASFTSLAWSLDGDLINFSNSERAAILEIWCRVAEDYAAFDVDVTTEISSEDKINRTDAADGEYGTRVLFSPQPLTTYYSICSGGYGACGGKAFLNAFGFYGNSSQSNTYFQPALVFTNALANFAKYMAEAATHEAGHNLNLFHDGVNPATGYYLGHGSGTTSWAPIMGAGYYTNLTQWSKGEYAGANNQEDDFAIISTFIPYRTDDHGNDSSSATAVTISNGTAAKSGIIEKETDLDVFGITIPAGTLVATARPENLGPNLDIKMTLKDANFNTISEINPAASLNASLTTPLAAGSYFLVIEGINFANPLNTGYSKYGVVGNFDLALTFSPTVAQAPIAVVQTSATSILTNSSIQFTGSGSFDYDGTITAYSWNFGDGTSSTETNPNHTYTSAGIFSATLTVTDNLGATGSKSVAITVINPNQNPTANFTSSTQSGFTPLTVNFDASSSSDSDGSITSFAWDFGDGLSGSGATTSHVFSPAGNYVVALTITDDRGGTSTTKQDISVSPESKQLRIKSLAVKKGKNGIFKIIAIVETTSGKLVQGAQILGNWSLGSAKKKSKKTTNASGIASFSTLVSGSSRVKFTVTGISKPEFTYNACENITGILNFKPPTSSTSKLKPNLGLSANCS